jgi:hypothetical protein
VSVPVDRGAVPWDPSRTDPLAGGDDPDLRRARLPDGHRPLPFFDSGTPWLAGERGLPAPLPWKGTPHPWRCSLLGGVGKQPYPFIGLGSLPPARRHGPHGSRTGSLSERSPKNVATTASAHKQKGPPAPEDGAGGPLPAECSPGAWERAAGTLLAPSPLPASRRYSSLSPPVEDMAAAELSWWPVTSRQTHSVKRG